ncbi:hypothetical protein DPMN_097226 [Dreissena polymorpha]|uniref:Uncharacterized protein n=1 Tax=Dreissena polymorpha TaxID=45954 RepID=A0A9D4LA61_DREPO|nr:hypothetical protein DPMN_097226 [Dreissena polymorpha]
MLCQTVSQTVGAPAGDSQIVCDDAKTVRAPAGDSKTVCDGAKTSWHLQERPRRCQKTVGIPSGDSQTVCDCANTNWAPAGDGARQSPRLRGVGDSQTVCDYANTVWAPAGDSQTVPDSRTIGAPAGDSDSMQLCQDRLGTDCRLPYDARQSPRPSDHLQETL